MQYGRDFLSVGGFTQNKASDTIYKVKFIAGLFRVQSFFAPLQYNSNNSTWTLMPVRLRIPTIFPGVFVVNENNVDCKRANNTCQETPIGNPLLCHKLIPSKNRPNWPYSAQIQSFCWLHFFGLMA